MKLLGFLQKPRRPRIVLRRVMGQSMMPTIQPDSLVVGLWPCRVRNGDIVIIRHDGLDKIKRVKGVREGQIFLAGDNSAASTDSHDFGWLDCKFVLAKVCWF